MPQIEFYKHILYTLCYIKHFFKIRFLFNEEEMEQIIRTNEDFDSGCLPEPQCLEPDTYRTIDGSCNQRDNLKNLGRAASGYRRFLSPAYDDGKIPILFIFYSANYK